MELKSGAQLGPYEITAPIGAGGMGEVYRAHDVKLDRDVAIKVLPDEFTAEPGRLARFEREAKVLASLNHPNIAAIYGVEELDGKQCLVLELAQGEDLSARIARGPLPIDEALDVARQIADGLAAAHERGVVHRDLKPANIKVSPEGLVKLLDFGLAKAWADDAVGTDLAPLSSRSPTKTQELTSAGVLLGTASYMSPEQARGKAVDRRTDIWALGCVLYEMLVGKRPFGGATVTDTLASTLTRGPDWVALPAQLSPPVRRVLGRCLEKDPRRRLQHAGDARIELEEALAHSEEATAPAATRPRWAALGLVALLAAAAGGLAVRILVSPGPVKITAETHLHVNLENPLYKGGVPGRSLALSPDGSRLVYVAHLGSDTQLFVRDMNTFDERALAGTEGGKNPFFSPDGKTVGFFAAGSLKKVALVGGTPVRICTAPGLHWGASWGADDTIVFATSTHRTPVRVQADGGTPEKIAVTGIDEIPEVWQWPHLLPGGRAILATVAGASDGQGALVAVISLENGATRILTEGYDAIYVASRHVLYGRDGSMMAAPFDPETLEFTGPSVSLPHAVRSRSFANSAAVSDTGTLVYDPAGGTNANDLVWVDRDGRVTRLTKERLQYYAPRLSPDGTKIAVGHGFLPGGDLWVHDLARDTATRVAGGLANQDSELPRLNGYPCWAPDGERLFFLSNTDIYWKSIHSGALPEPLLEGSIVTVPQSLTPDGKRLLYYEVRADTQRDLWVLPMGGEPEPLLVTQHNERAATFSSDGGWFAYVSDESGRDEVYVRAFPDTGRRWKVSSEGGTEPVWSRDGEELFYRHGDSMMAVGVVTEPEFRAERPEELFTGHYVLDGYGNPQYDVSPGRQRFLMVQGESAPPAQLRIVLNWFDELRQLAPPAIP